MSCVLARRRAAFLAGAALAVALGVPSPVGAAPPADGFFVPSETGVPVPGADGTEARVGERLELRVLSARVAARGRRTWDLLVRPRRTPRPIRHVRGLHVRCSAWARRFRPSSGASIRHNRAPGTR